MRQMLAPYEPGRSAAVMRDHQLVGVVGEYRADVAAALKLPAFAAGFEVFLSAFRGTAGAQPYVALPRFPKIEQDLCLKVSFELPYAELFQFVWGQLDQNRPGQTYHSLAPVDIYQREDDQAHKQITLRLEVASYERTLTDQEVNQLLDGVAHLRRVTDRAVMGELRRPEGAGAALAGRDDLAGRTALHPAAERHDRHAFDVAAVADRRFAVVVPLVGGGHHLAGQYAAGAVGHLLPQWRGDPPILSSGGCDRHGRTHARSTLCHI
jgi:hypothetical protein